MQMKPLLSCLFLAIPTIGITQTSQTYFDDIDANQDNIITPGELETYRMSQFKIIDTNQDNIITRQELLNGNTSWKSYTQENTTAFLIMYDVNGDGAVTKNEVQKVSAQINIFDNLDFDQNGKLTPEDVKDIFPQKPKGIPKENVFHDLQQGKRNHGNGFHPIKPQNYNTITTSQQNKTIKQTPRPSPLYQQTPSPNNNTNWTKPHVPTQPTLVPKTNPFNTTPFFE